MKKLRKLIGLGILTLAGAFCLLRIHAVSRNLYSQQAAERWQSKEQRYAQISVFFAGRALIEESAVNSYRSSMQKSLEEASITAENSKGRLWVDAYSAQAASVVSKDKKTQDVNLIGVSDDFFQFHPLNMQDGHYFTGQELTKDRVVIEEKTAWHLFGSNDVEGMTLTLESKELIIAGVYRAEQGKTEDYAFGENPTLFISYELLKQIHPESAGINVYEILLPNPVRDFAKQMVLKNIAGVDLSTNSGSEIKLEDLDIEVVENTNRFSYIRLLKIIKETGLRVMQRKGMIYPYWENICRAKENEAAGLLLLSVIFYIVPAVCLIRYLSMRFKNRKWTWGRIRQAVEDKIERKRRKDWEKKKKKHEKTDG